MPLALPLWIVVGPPCDGVVRVRIERVGEPAGHQSPVGAEVGARLAGFAGFGIVSLPRVNTWI